MPNNANWYGYHYYVKGELKHAGITQDYQRREQEHQQRWPGGSLRVLIGPTTEAAARAWEALQPKTITPERR